MEENETEREEEMSRNVGARFDVHEDAATASRVVMMGLSSGGDYYKVNVDANGNIKTNPVYYTTLRDWSAGKLIYEGFAEPGTAVSAAGWLIRRYTWDGANNTKVEYANGETAFDKIWDNRATYSFS